MIVLYGCEKRPESPIEEAYPFSEASRVEIISYDFSHDDTENIKYYEIKNGKMGIPSKKIIDRIPLKMKEINELYNILYTDCTSETLMADCYYPAHRIVFYDGKEKVIAYIELCITCHDYRSGGDKYNPIPGLCDEKIALLEQYLKSVGITHFSQF